jgi:hypothetical protein
MSYIRIQLPEITLLKQELKENPNQISYYAKYEGFGGSEKSVAFLKKKLEEYFNKKSFLK